MPVTASDLVGELLDGGGPAGGPWAVSAGSGGSTRRELRTQVGALTRRFAIQGIGPDATVALHMRPSFTLVWTLLALWNVGAQVLLLDIADRDVRGALTRWPPRFHVRSGGFGPAAARFVRECEVAVHYRHGAPPARTDHCLLQLTAGRTGPRRIVGRDPASLLAELHRFRALPDAPGAGERVLVAAPLARPAWLVAGLLHAIACGATVLVPETRPTGAAAPAGADVLLTTPDGLSAALDGPATPGSLRLAVVTGGPVAPADAIRVRSRRGIALGSAYGTTETGLIACDLSGEHGTHSVGPVLPGVRTRLRAGRLDVLLDRSPHVDGPTVVGGPGHWARTGDRVSVGAAGDLVLDRPHEPVAAVVPGALPAAR